MARSRFKTANEGYAMAVRSWACKNCGEVYSAKQFSPCHCGCDKYWHLASKAEAQRFAELWLLVGTGDIERLEAQKPFVLKVGGQVVCTYIADFFYRSKTDGRWHVEDVKPEQHQAPVFKLKKRLFDACYKKHRLEIKIVKVRTS